MWGTLGVRWDFMYSSPILRGNSCLETPFRVAGFNFCSRQEEGPVPGFPNAGPNVLLRTSLKAAKSHHRGEGRTVLLSFTHLGAAAHLS